MSMIVGAGVVVTIILSSIDNVSPAFSVPESMARCPQDCVTIINGQEDSPCTPIDYTEKFFKCFCEKFDEDHQKDFFKCVNSTIREDSAEGKNVDIARFFCGFGVYQHCFTLSDKDCHYYNDVVNYYETSKHYLGVDERPPGYYKNCRIVGNRRVCNGCLGGNNPIKDGDPTISDQV